MKKQTRNYKTLKGFFFALAKSSKSSHFVFTFSDYLRGYFITWINGEYTQVYFSLSEEAKAELFALMAGAITSSKGTAKKYAAIMAEYIGRDYGIFSRLWIQKAYTSNKIIGDYCAGQDWISETRTVQSLLRKGSLYF